jgi:serine protease Do
MGNPCSRLTALCAALCLCLLPESCSIPRKGPSSPLPSPSDAPIPSPPGLDRPIDPLALIAYFGAQTAELLKQGKINTNLLHQVHPKTCTLTLLHSSTMHLAPPELAKAVEMSVAVVGQVVRMQKGPPQRLLSHATGFFITESGALVTAWHVLQPPYILSLVVMTRNGAVYPVNRLLAVDEVNDIAIVQVDGTDFTALPLANIPAPQGTPVWVLSHPLWRYYTFTSGNVASYFLARNLRAARTLMNITADFGNGSSGAPVLNDQGEVVAVADMTQGITADAENRNTQTQMVMKVCVPCPEIRRLIH